MVNKLKDHKSLLLLGASFWTLFSIAGMVGAFKNFSDVPVFWFVPLFLIALSAVSFSARRIPIRVAFVSVAGGMMIFIASFSIHFFHRVMDNYFTSFSSSRGEISHDYPLFTDKETAPDIKKIEAENAVGQLYATCLFGDRQTMIDKMRERDAFTWFAYSRFGSPQDIFGGFDQQPRDKKACEDLIELGLLEHQEVGCTGLMELCDLENSDRCEVQRRQCKVVLSSPFE